MKKFLKLALIITLTSSIYASSSQDNTQLVNTSKKWQWEETEDTDMKTLLEENFLIINTSTVSFPYGGIGVITTLQNPEELDDVYRIIELYTQNFGPNGMKVYELVEAF